MSQSLSKAIWQMQVPADPKAGNVGLGLGEVLDGSF